MNLRIIGFGILLGTASGFCQDLEPKFQLESSVGFVFYHKALDFETSPSFGLGAGLDISHLLQLNLSFSYSPTHQNISQAASELRARYQVYFYDLELNYCPHRSFFGSVQPFGSLGAGSMIIDPQPVQVQIGAGQSVRLEPPVDFHWSASFGGGLVVAIVQKLQIQFKIKRTILRLDSSETVRKWIANNALQVSFSTKF